MSKAGGKAKPLKKPKKEDKGAATLILPLLAQGDAGLYILSSACPVQTWTRTIRSFSKRKRKSRQR